MAKSDKPNILIIWGDDIGYWNISHYSKGMMGYETPNIDRIAQEGATFTDWYGQQSCTAGRACFITGQNPIRTGLTKVGLPGATVGLHAEDPTIAEMLKPLGYATGQFGKNHLGDRDEYLPTVHGFEEFYGNLYHLNAEEEPELPDYPKDPEFKKMFGPRGVLHCLADGDGGQKITDTGPLTKKRMETIDEEITEGALAWMEKQAKAEQPFFLWYNSTAMHFRTHLADKNRGKSGQDDYSDRMVTHDEQVGELLKKLDELGIADNTIVMYSTDNGPENDTWPDGANTPFRAQKDTNWEGAWRVPAFLRWPGKIKAGSVFTGIGSHIDMFPTLLAAAGDVELTVRATRHGPVLSDINADLASFAGPGKAVALAFTGLGDRDTTAEAMMRVNSARNWGEFLDALRLFQTPTQNFVFADVAGDIGFLNPGLVPLRKSGARPRPGRWLVGRLRLDWRDPVRTMAPAAQSRTGLRL